MRIETGTGGSTVACSFIAMFENLTKVCHTWFALFGNSQGVVERQHFYQATQNGTRTAGQSKTHILKSSGFWFYNNYNNLLRAPWKRRAKIKPKSKHGTKGSWIEPNGHNFLSWIIENSINCYTTIQTIELTWWCWKWMSKTVKKLL